MNIQPDNDGLIHLTSTGTCTMELTPYMAERLRDAFELELEMMRGTKELLPDGRTRYIFEITDEEKGRMIVDFIRMLPNHTTICNN